MSSDSRDPIEQRRLRRVLGKFATGVTVITVRADNGANLGVTANSFNSVSLDPPLILWSLSKSAASVPVFKAAEYFAVHVLAEDQVDLSDHFARKKEDKFASVAFTEGLGKTPLIGGCSARFQCRTHATHDGGDHWIIVGEVVRFEEGGRPALVYYQGSYAISVPYQDSSGTALQAEAHEPPVEQGIYFQLVRAVHAMQDSLAPVHEAFGVSVNEVRVLGMLMDNVGCDESYLSHHARAPLPEMRAVLHDLQRRKLIEPSSTRTVWALTPQGNEVARALWAQRQTQERRALEALSAGEIEVLQRSLRRIGDWGDSQS